MSCAIKSKIISKIFIDKERIENDIELLGLFNYNTAYSEYALGSWNKHIVWNQHGDQKHGFVHDYSGGATPTEVGNRLNYVSALIEENFEVSHLKFARIISIRDCGLIVPHRDYLDLAHALYRIHIPIQVNDSSFSSEGEYVFQMKFGEVWYLDATQVHSAASFAKEQRLHLVLDFETSVPMESLFKFDQDRLTHPVIPVNRGRLSGEHLDALLSLSRTITVDNFYDIVAILAKVHFRKAVHAEEMFGWLDMIARNSNDSGVIEKANVLYEKCGICIEQLQPETVTADGVSYEPCSK